MKLLSISLATLGFVACRAQPPSRSASSSASVATASTAAVLVDAQATSVENSLAFFNHLSGALDIKLSEPTHQAAPHLLNQQASASARLVDVKLRLEMFVEPEARFRELTDEERRRIVLRTPTLRLRGLAKKVVQHQAPNGQFFTVSDLEAAIEETERKTRGTSEWLGGVDVHHRFFEGIHLEDDGVWAVHWGS